MPVDSSRAQRLAGFFLLHLALRNNCYGSWPDHAFQHLIDLLVEQKHEGGGEYLRCLLWALNDTPRYGKGTPPAHEPTEGSECAGTVCKSFAFKPLNSPATPLSE